MAVEINKQKTASAASEKKADASEKKAAASGATKFEKGKQVEAKSEKRAARSLKFTERMEYAATLCLSQKLSDEDIKAKVVEKFSDYPVVFDTHELGRARWMIKHDMLPNVHADGRCFDRCYMIDGKLVAKADKPKSVHAKRKAQYNAESDPLNTIAGVNVHNKEKETSAASATREKEPVKKAKKHEAAPATESDAL